MWWGPEAGVWMLSAIQKRPRAKATPPPRFCDSSCTVGLFTYVTSEFQVNNLGKDTSVWGKEGSYSRKQASPARRGTPLTLALWRRRRGFFLSLR